LLLRFAITRDSLDAGAVLVVAHDIDTLGVQPGQSAPSFFRRTSDEVCKAIGAPEDPKNAVVLRKHLARIDEPRLQRAFRAAIGLAGRPPSRKNKSQNLWNGLQRRK
jgi:hypothetical protein